MDVRYDLHSHSLASDGTLSPAGLVTAARAAGVDVLALTDHDTTDGIAGAAHAAVSGLIPERRATVVASGRDPLFLWRGRYVNTPFARRESYAAAALGGLLPSSETMSDQFPWLCAE